MIDPELYKKANIIIQRMYKYYFLKDSNKNPGQRDNDMRQLYEQAQREMAEYQSIRRQLDRYNYNLSNQILTRDTNEEIERPENDDE